MRRSRRCCACRTSTTCTRACRSSSRISRSADRASFGGVFLAIERFMIRRSRVVIVICPSLEETVRAIEPRRADRAHRERAGIGRRSGRRRRRHAVRPTALGLDAVDAGRPVHRDVRGVSGARPAVRGDGDRAARAARRAAPARRRQARSGGARAGAGARGRHRATSRSLPASGRRRRFRRICSRPTCSCRRGRAARTRR